MDREYIKMGGQFDAMPLNSSPIYADASEKDYERYTPSKDSTLEELERRKTELNRPRTGFDYEIARLIASDMGLKGKNAVRTREVNSFGELFCLLNRKESDGQYSVDMVMSGIAKDEKYNNTISWSVGYVTFGYALIVKKSSDIENLKDLKGKTIGIIKDDSSVESYVQQQIPDAKIVKYDDSEWGWTDCAINGHDCKGDENSKLPRVDACIYDLPFSIEEMKQVSTQDRQKLTIRKSDLPNSTRDYRIGVAKGNDDLLEKINDAISKIKASPMYQSLLLKYINPRNIVETYTNVTNRSYIVKKGDSLTLIARNKLNDTGRWQELKELNNVGNEYLIYPGQTIYLPEQ